MPIGLVVMNWNERIGTDIKAKYPEEINIKGSSLMQIYSQHEFSGDAGMVSFISGSLSVASYYTGPETNYYVILLLEMEEDADSYEDGLADISREIMANLDGDAYQNIMPSLFQRISVYPKLNEEQKLAMVYHSEIKRMLINRLREETVISKAELLIWLKDRYQDGFFDLDAILVSLIKMGLVKIASVKGLSTELVFFVKDMLISRIPPVVLFDDIENRGLPKSLKESYCNEVVNFFKEYNASDDDSLKLIDQIILDPEVYETLKLLRVAAVTRNDLEKLRKKGVEDIDGVLKKLWEVKMIFVFQDADGNEYYCLSSDFHIRKFYPDYLINKIRTAYVNKSQSSEVLLEELELLKEEFWDSKDESKKSKRSKSEITA